MTTDCTTTHVHTWTVKSEAPNERGTMMRQVWGCKTCPVTRVERTRLDQPAAAFNSSAAFGDAIAAAEAAHEDLSFDSPTEAEMILINIVESIREGLDSLRLFREFAPRGILHPNTIKMMRELQDSFEPRLDEATRCALAVALGTRGHDVHKIAPGDFPALLAALVAA